MKYILTLANFLICIVSIAQINKKDITYIAPFTKESSVSWYRLKTNDRVGIIAKDSTIITEPFFNYVDQFRNGYAQAGVSNKRKILRGLINEMGEVTVPFDYDDIYPNDYSAIVSLNKKQGIVNFYNTIILPVNYDLVRNYGNFYLVMLNDKMALFTLNKGFISDFIFTDLVDTLEESIVVKDDSFQYLIDLEGVVVYKTNFNEKIVDAKDHWLIIENKELLQSRLYHIKQNSYSNFFYNDLRFTSNGLVAKEDNKYGIVDYDGNIIVPILYDYIYNSNEHTIVKKDNYYGLYYNNALKLPIVYKDIMLHKNGKYFFVFNKNGNNGLYNLNVEPIIPEKGEILLYKNDSYFLKENDKLAIYNLVSKDFIYLDETFQYQPTANYFLGLNKSYYILLKKNSNYGAVNYNGEISIPFEYEDLRAIYASPYFIAKKNGKYGIINKENLIEKAFIYDKAELIKEVVYLYKGNKKADWFSVTFE